MPEDRTIAVTRSDLSTDLAAELVGNAVAEARRLGVNICAVVVDSSGLPLATLRMNGVSEMIVGFATDKAKTAATFRRATDEMRDRLGADHLWLGASSRTNLMLWGGGLPIFHQDQCIGSIGVSGALVQQDIQCAEAALSASGLQQG